MADNTRLNVGVGGDIIASDEIAGTKHQRVKVQYGEDGSAVDVSVLAPLPVEDIPTIAALGESPELIGVTRVGDNADIDTGVAEDVWTAGGLWEDTPNTSAEIVDITSDSTSDDTGGVGLQSVEVFGLDTNFDLQSEVVLMLGTLTATTSNTYIVVYQLIAKATGSSNANVGVVTATGNVSTNLYAHMAIGDSGSFQLTHVIPAGFTALIYRGLVEVDGPATARIEFKLMVFDTVLRPFWRPIQKAIVTGARTRDAELPVPFKITEKTYIKIEATSDTNNVRVLGSLTMVMRNPTP